MCLVDYIITNKKVLTFELPENVSDSITIEFSTPSKTTITFGMLFQFTDSSVNDVLIGGLILMAMYFCIIFELAHRTVVTMLTATFVIGYLAVVDFRPSFGEIMTWIDVETLILLFSMMVIVSIFSETGIFAHLGFLTFKKSEGRVWPLITVLSVVTAVISALLDNVTTVLLLTPVVIQLCEAINCDVISVLVTVRMHRRI